MKPLVDESYRFLAARYLRRRVKQLADQIEGLRKAEDLEFVHRARVASRRLRSALQLFGDVFPPRRLRVWKTEIRRLARSLGEARDRDVQIALLDDRLPHLPEAALHPGVARVLVHWERKREAAQPKVLRAADRLEASRIVRQMLRATQGATRRNEPAPTAFTPAAFEQFEQHVTTRCNELHALRDSLRDPTAVEQHHALRIAAKRLRYTLEICKPLYGERIDGVLETVKQVQTLLGDLHDCDVWLARLDAFLQRERRRIERRYGHDGPIARLLPGVEYLQADRRRRREELFDALVRYWNDLQREGLWDDLLAIVRSREPASSNPAAGVPAWNDSKPNGATLNGAAPNGSARESRPMEPCVANESRPTDGRPENKSKTLQSAILRRADINKAAEAGDRTDPPSSESAPSSDPLFHASK